MKIIDGRSIGNSLCAKLSLKIKQLRESHGIFPCLKIILVGNDPASHLYARNKQKEAESVGIESEVILLPTTVTEDEVIAKIQKLNCDRRVNGIMVMLPVPAHTNADLVITAIDPEKDVDGLHYENVGRLVTGQMKYLAPCTAQGCMHLIKSVEPNLAGKHAVVIGRSNIVGKPMSHLLLRENCTVTILHSHGKNLAMHCAQADIVISAVGNPKLVKQSWIKTGAIVIDAGINFVPKQNEPVGDVDFSDVKDICNAITPVPGGVGPMTVAYLMINTVLAACRQHGISFDLV